VFHQGTKEANVKNASIKKGNFLEDWSLGHAEESKDGKEGEPGLQTFRAQPIMRRGDRSQKRTHQGSMKKRFTGVGRTERAKREKGDRRTIMRPRCGRSVSRKIKLKKKPKKRSERFLLAGGYLTK